MDAWLWTLSGPRVCVVTMTNANYPYNDELYLVPLALADAELSDAFFETEVNDEPIHRDINDRTINPSAYGILPIRKHFLESWIWTMHNRFVHSVVNLERHKRALNNYYLIHRGN
ncbi:uncharacterized protein LOC118740644 [Rhagoletis pomonella]|uniref:uncharacterized protein LOC118740644 n=1 Tax=Rhagoletis pomonella TaxID=28610 RepID=UPI001785A4E2|nr:uncharacterized protein LOC118740644 [Rhagoletis pomonella]